MLDRHADLSIRFGRNGLDHHWSPLDRVGGLALAVEGVLYILLAVMSARLYNFSFPTSAESYLQLVSQHQSLAAAQWWLWIVADVVLGLGVIALWLTLVRYNPPVVLIGTLFVAFFIAFDIGVTELNSLTLVSLSDGYSKAGAAALQASYVGAATYAFAALPFQTLLSFASGSLGLVLLAVVMLRGPLGRSVAIFGIVANGAAALGGVGAVLPVLGLFTLPSLVLAGLWFIVVGVQLYRLAMRPRVEMGGSVTFEAAAH